MPYNILSLFDGISCGQVALNRANILYGYYFASEIDKFAMQVTQHNYPNTIQLGDVTKINTKILPNIDLLIGGSPCQGFSYSGKMLNFDDPRSKLFFEYVRVLKEIQPKFFLLENVAMKQEWQDIISEYLGVQPILIDSGLVSGQERRRLYWTNIQVQTLPKNKNIKFTDVVGDGWYCGAMRGRRIDPITKLRCDANLSIPLKQYIESRHDDKSNCLTTAAKDNVAMRVRVNRVLASEVEYRYLTPNEYELLQTLPVDYTACVSDSQRRKLIGNGWNVDTISHILSFLPNI